MVRVLIVGVNVAILAFVYLAVAILEAGFTAQGMPATPSRMTVAVFVLRALTLDGATLLGIVKVLVAASVIISFSALFAVTPQLRFLRWIGTGASLVALGYLVHAFPSLASADRLPWPLIVLAGLFLGCGLLLAMLPTRQDPASAQGWAALFLWAFGLGGVVLLGYGIVSRPLAMSQLAVAAGCILAYAGVYYCLLHALAGKNKKASPEQMFLLLIPLVFAGVALVYVMPLALPVVAGLAVYATAYSA